MPNATGVNSPGSYSHLQAKRSVNGLAIASFICALAGIPIFGIITGFVAILLAVIALGAIRSNSQRGLGLAISGLLLGLVDIVGWIALIVWMLPWAGNELSADLHFSELPPDLSVIQELAPPLQRAMRANVLIERPSGIRALGGKAMGSGVILKLTGGEALIVTNRHVVDDDFPSGRGSTVDSNRLSRMGKMSISMLGQQQVEGRVVWLAPGQIDLALLEAHCRQSREARDAAWKQGRPMNVGLSVFAIGNPYRLGWTHTQGVISQMRTQNFDSHRVRVIQTQASINPGNSGGGLYDHEGYLLGINTWTTDKSLSEGISFAISLDSLLQLAPPPLELKAELTRPATMPRTLETKEPQQKGDTP
jgi:S1-C subfamily serine protease